MPDYSQAIEEIKARCNIIDVIGATVSLKRSGSTVKGCCPFHNEKTPSFVVNEKQQYYHCFGCQESGDVFSYVQKYYKLDFVSAVEKLAAQYGVEIKKDESVGSYKRDEMFEANRLAASFFYNNLKTGKNEGSKYLNERKLNQETVKNFGIGYAGEKWTGLVDFLKSKAVKEETMLELGLVSKSSKDGKLYDKYRGRLMFPIINTRGKVIGFGGRIIGEGEPKYLNSSESAVFKKKDNLFGLNKAKDSIISEGFAYMVEGYMDVVSLYQNGIKNVVASLGTALTENQAKLLSKYCKKVILCYDADAAGIKAAIRGIDVLRAADMDVKVLHVEGAKDPDEYVKKYGKDAFVDLTLKKSLEHVDYKVKLIQKKYNRNNNEENIKFIQAVAGVLSGLKPAEKEVYTKYLSKQLQISEETLNKEAELVLKNKNEAQTIETKIESEPKQELTKADKNLINLIIKLSIINPDYYKEFLKYEAYIQGDNPLAVWKALSCTYEENEEFTIDSLRDYLEENEFIYLSRVLNEVIVGEEKSAFDDCIAKLIKKDKQKQIDTIERTIKMLEDLPPDKDRDEELNKQLLMLSKLRKQR